MAPEVVVYPVIALEVWPGAHVASAVADALDFARRVPPFHVHLLFNGQDLHIRRDDAAAELIDQYHHRITRVHRLSTKEPNLR